MSQQNKKNLLDSLFLSEEVKKKIEADRQRQHIKNVMCSYCENISYCPGGIAGCGAFKRKGIFNK